MPASAQLNPSAAGDETTTGSSAPPFERARS
jgi:hypothetical protein